MKKKKKTIHLRKVRSRSENKVEKTIITDFFTFIKYYSKKMRNKKFCFCSFLLCFKSINLVKIFNLFKIFGLNKFFVFKKFPKSIDLFFFALKKTLSKLKYNLHIKAFNVEKKKNLFLHVSYRHFLKLPVRGQRTRTNAKTRKHYAII